MILENAALKAKTQQIAQILENGGIKVDELSTAALALLLVRICVTARVDKKQFRQVIADSWRLEVALRERVDQLQKEAQDEQDFKGKELGGVSHENAEVSGGTGEGAGSAPQD